MNAIPLAVDGANPLGFLATLGVAQLLAESKSDGQEVREVRLRWTGGRSPVLAATGLDDGEALVQCLTVLARRPPSDQANAEKEKAARDEFEKARREERKKRDEIKKRKLPRDRRKATLEAEHAPLAQSAALLRTRWRAARASAAPDPSVSMGLDLNATSAEFSEHCRDALEAATATSRRWVDLCASFGSEGKPGRMEATPFALVSGSGHQHFLGTAGELMVACTNEHFRRALLEPWLPTDDGSSFRWDPDDDRRYALRADDPTASSSKPKTLWGANRLAFEALRLFPCMRGRGGAATVAWRRDGDFHVWRWPLWGSDLSVPVIRSLLADSSLWNDDPESRRRLRARGVFSVLQTRRITIGKAPNQKLNFTPAVPAW